MATRHTNSLTRTILAAVLLSALFLAASSNARAVTVVNPPDGIALKTQPVDFRGTASLNVFTYNPEVSMNLYQMSTGKQYYRSTQCTAQEIALDLLGCRPTLTPVEWTFWTGYGEDALDIDGDWNIHTANLSHRSPDVFDMSRVGDDRLAPLPNGSPLPDGKYLIRVLQINHMTGDIADPDSPDHAHAQTFFWIDGKQPDTVLDSATPALPTSSTSRVFAFHSADPVPSSGSFLECRIDGGDWDHCDLNQLVKGDVDRTGTFEATGLGEGLHVFEARATDMAGNEDPTPASETWGVDLTPPDITIDEPQMRKRYVLGQHVPSDFSCEDPLAGDPAYASGVKTCDGPATVDTSKLGNLEFTVKAEDNAGNKSEKTYSYAVDPPRYGDVIGAGDPIAYYRLSDPLGANVMADSSGNHHDGEYKNGIALERPAAPNCERRPHPPHSCDLTAAPEDFSAYFPARDGYGFTNGIVAPQNGYTLEAWIKRADEGAGSVIGQGGAGQLFVNSDGRLALRQTQDTVTSSGPVLTPGQWFHVAATWDGSVVRLYVNGEMVGSSSTANKPPSGSATLYVGYGDQAPWFHGQIDEAAYYGTALPGGAFATRYAVGTAHDVPGPVGGPAIQRPDAHIITPPDGALYARTKTPNLEFHCSDLDGDATVAACTATVDGNPAADGSVLPDGPGTHTVTVTAIDNAELTRTHTHTYEVKTFQDIYTADRPIAYYRLGDATDSATMVDSSGNHRDGTYKNAQESGPVGVSGDGDRARRFHGVSGYGFTNGIAAPTTQGSMEAWVNPDDGRDQSIMGQGDAGEIYIEDGVFKFRHMGTVVSAHVGPTPGRFTQVVAVWDGVTISLYVDGELHGQVEATKRPSSVSTLYVGYGEIKPWFKGSLDEVVYYGSALTPDRVLQHFLADPPADEPGPYTADPPDPGTADPGTDPGDDPVTGDDPQATTDPKPDVKPISAPAEKGKSARKVSKAKKAKKAKARCKRIKKAKKRRSCLRRVRRL